MANIKKLKANGQDIVPITHEQAVLDSNGVTLDSKLNAINNAISRLENNSTSNTPSLVGNALTFGNYTIKYNETSDTLDFIYNGATDVPIVPPTEEVVPLTWIDNRNINISGVENDDTSAMVTDYLTKEDGYNYTINLTNVSSVKIYFFDSSKTFISRTDNLTVNSTDILIEFPENTSYFRIKSDKGTATVDNANNYIILKKNESDVPTTEEVIPLTWEVGNLSGTDGSEQVQESCLRSGFATIEDNCHYSFYLDKALGDPRGVRVYFYDTNKTYINRTSGDTLEYTSGSLISIDVPDNAAYMRFKANLDSSTTLSNISTLFTLRKTKTAIVNSYVREGLSMYIDANDVATYGSVRDITENYTVTNNGVSLTSDKKYLNFVSTESDYLDTNFVPNLTKWSAEVYFYFTEAPTNSQSIVCWGGSNENKLRIVYSKTYKGLAAQSNNEPTRVISDKCNLLTPHHLIVTMNNGALTSYLDGVKTILCASGGTQGSHSVTLKVGTNYGVSEEFANINLRMFRFYDGKVLSDVEALQNYRYELKNSYVTDGLSLYIDAQDVATQGTIRDITSKQTIVNHGVSTTLDNGCLNFVSSESDYIDCGFKPNLTQWSAEFYFYFTNMPTGAETVLGWGASGNRTAIGFWGTNFMIAITDNVENKITSTVPTSLTHVVLTYNNNGKIIAYVNGEKSQIATNANLMSSQAGNLMIGTKYSASGEFGNIHLKSLRFYDNKVLTDEEALQNYRYEINRDIIKPTWIYNKKPDSSTGQIIEGQDNACTVLIPYDSSYNYKLSIDTVAFFRVFYYDSSQSYIKNDSIADNFRGVITPPENTAYMRLKLARNSIELDDLDNHVIFRKTHK